MGQRRQQQRAEQGNLTDVDCLQAHKGDCVKAKKFYGVEGNDNQYGLGTCQEIPRACVQCVKLFLEGFCPAVQVFATMKMLQKYPD